MIFNSVTYLLFLAVAVALFWLLPRRARLLMLFGASFIFYGFWRVEFLFLMLLSSFIDYVAGIVIHAEVGATRRRTYLICALAGNLGLLFYFKYLFFFAASGVSLLQVLGIDASLPALSIVLPLGISFYTFQSMSYTIDVYRGHIKPINDYVLFGCFVTFFPQLVAGPILRAGELVTELEKKPRFQLDDVTTGLRRVCYGLFLKVVLADNIAPLVDAGFDQPVADLSALDVWTLAFLFGFQIYFDFSAYSHIALGSARLMGIHFPENFNFPYLAASPREFWQRWHISLSSWIRDYLYLPLLGGQPVRRSEGGLTEVRVPPDARSSSTRALFLTWAIMGLWHGANWTFVCWGIYHALLVYCHRRVRPLAARLNPMPRYVGGLALTLPAVMASWIFFRAPNLDTAMTMYATLLSPGRYTSLGMRENVYLVAALVLAAFLITGWLLERLLPRMHKYALWILSFETLSLASITGLVFIFLRPISQFIYFQF